MKELTRRNVLASAATVSVAAALGELSLVTAARAGAPQIGKQAAGFYRYKLGDFEVSVVADGVVRLKLPPAFVTNVKTEDVQAALKANFLDTEMFNNTYTPIVVNTGKNLVVIDTGLGEGNREQARVRPETSSPTLPPPASTPTRSTPSSSRITTATT